MVVTSMKVRGNYIIYRCTQNKISRVITQNQFEVYAERGLIGNLMYVLSKQIPIQYIEPEERYRVHLQTVVLGKDTSRFIEAQAILQPTGERVRIGSESDLIRLIKHGIVFGAKYDIPKSKILNHIFEKEIQYQCNIQYSDTDTVDIMVPSDGKMYMYIGEEGLEAVGYNGEYVQLTKCIAYEVSKSNSYQLLYKLGKIAFVNVQSRKKLLIDTDKDHERSYDGYMRLMKKAISDISNNVSMSLEVAEAISNTSNNLRGTVYIYNAPGLKGFIVVYRGITTRYAKIDYVTQRLLQAVLGEERCITQTVRDVNGKAEYMDYKSLMIMMDMPAYALENPFLKDLYLWANRRFFASQLNPRRVVIATEYNKEKTQDPTRDGNISGFAYNYNRTPVLCISGYEFDVTSGESSYRLKCVLYHEMCHMYMSDVYGNDREDIGEDGYTLKYIDQNTMDWLHSIGKDGQVDFHGRKFMYIAKAVARTANMYYGDIFGYGLERNYSTEENEVNLTQDRVSKHDNSENYEEFIGDMISSINEQYMDILQDYEKRNNVKIDFNTEAETQNTALVTVTSGNNEYDFVIILSMNDKNERIAYLARRNRDNSKHIRMLGEYNTTKIDKNKFNKMQSIYKRHMDEFTETVIKKICDSLI